MQIAIDIHEKDLECLKRTGQVTYSLVDGILNGIVLPKNATNGDVIKALFPNTKIQEGERYTIWDVGTDNVSFWNNWWNAPYKVGDTDGNS